VNLAAVALEVGAPDNAQLAWADSHPDYPRSLIPYLRDQRLSVFAEPWPHLLGLPLNAEFRLSAPADCAGSVESTAALITTWPQTLRVSGWAWDVQDQGVPSAIVVTTDGVIAGLGVTGDRRTTEQIRGQTTSEFSGFTAYARDVSRTNSVDVYAVSRSNPNTVCHIATINPK